MMWRAGLLFLFSSGFFGTRINGDFVWTGTDWKWRDPEGGMLKDSDEQGSGSGNYGLDIIQDEEPEIQIFGRTNNNYIGGAMVKIGQLYFTVEPRNLLNEGVKLTPINDLDIESEYKEIESLGADVEKIMPGIYLTDLGEGVEMIALIYDFDNNTILGIKLTGDEYVPAIEVHFMVDQTTLNGSTTYAYRGHEDPFQVEAALEITGPASFVMYNGKKLGEYDLDYDYSDAGPNEYVMVDLMEEYKKFISSTNLEEKDEVMSLIVVEERMGTDEDITLTDLEEIMGTEPEIQIFGRTNNNYIGGAMVKIGQLYFTVEPRNLLNEGVKLTPIHDVDIDSEYKEIALLGTDVEKIKPGIYLTDLDMVVEMIALTYDFDNNTILAIKLTGDEYVPATEVHFMVDQTTLNGSTTYAYPGYEDPFQVEATLEITGPASFVMNMGKKLEDYSDYDYDYSDDGPDEYYLVNLMEEYKKFISSTNLEEKDEDITLTDLEEIMGTNEEMVPDFCAGCTLDLLSPDDDDGMEPDALQKEQLQQLRLILQEKDRQIENLNYKIWQIDAEINETLDATTIEKDLDEHFFEMKEDKIRQAAIIADLESGAVLTDCQKKASVLDRSLAREITLRENYLNEINIEKEHDKTMKSIVKDNTIFTNLHKQPLLIQGKENEQCQIILSNQNDKMLELTEEEYNLIDKKVVVEREFAELSAKIENNIEKEKQLKIDIENQKNTIEANRKKISILQKTVTDLSQYVPDCNITIVEESEDDVAIIEASNEILNDLRSFNVENLTHYINLNADIKKRLDTQNGSFALCLGSKKSKFDELRSVSRLHTSNIQMLIQELNNLLPLARQISIPAMPQNYGLPHPPRESLLKLDSLHLTCPPKTKLSTNQDSFTIACLDGACNRPEDWPTCQKVKSKLTLVGGKTPSEGNVYFNLSPVCDDDWDESDGKVVCKELGFLGFLHVTRKSNFGSVSSYFGMDDVNCKGDEDMLEDCYYKSNDDCSGSEGAGVVCWDGEESWEDCRLSCTDFISENGFGRCKKLSPTLNSPTCYVKASSQCTDKIKSVSNPGWFYSAKACISPQIFAPANVNG